MGRVPLLWPVVLWSLGLALARSDALPVSAAAAVFLATLLLLLLFRQGWLALVLLLGVVWGVADLFRDAADVVVPERWLQGDQHIAATVEQVSYGGTSLRLILTELEGRGGGSLQGKALLYLYGKQETLPVAGQRIEATVRWRLPRNFNNPGSFDYRAWCFDRAIAVVGSARGGIRVVGGNSSMLQEARQRIAAAIALAGKREQGILHAVLLGDRSRVDAEVDRLFSATGSAHLLAISGMHVGMAAGWMFFLAWWLLTRREGWIVTLPVRRIALFSGLMAALVYALLAGWPLPAIRAACMLSAGVVAWQLASRHEPFNTLLAALGLILIVDASAITSLSLWLSFAATAALLVWGKRSDRSVRKEGIQRLLPAIRMLFWSSLLALLATLPMVLSTFGALPAYGLPANLLLVPLYGLLVLPTALLGEVAAIAGLTEMAGLLMQASGVAAGIGVDLTSWIAALPAGALHVVDPPLWLSFVYVSGMLIAGALWWQQRVLWASLMLLSVLGGYVGVLLDESDVATPTWVVWDVGQGAASTLLLPGNEVVSVDVPGREGSRFNGGTEVAAGLRTMGKLHADVLVLSHTQSDHLGGALSLLSGLNGVREIWLPDVPSAHAHRLIQRLESEAGSPSIRWLSKGNKIKGREFQAEVLWPPKGHAPVNHNNSSLVLRITLNSGGSLLLPGDIETEVEKQLLIDSIAPVDAMLMPHHGSKSSSSSAFISRLNPSIAIAQTGWNNRYRFPSDAVVSRFRGSGAKTFNTADGAVMLTFSGQAKPLEWNARRPGRREMVMALLR